MGQGYEGTPVESDRLDSDVSELAEELARIITRHCDLIMQLTVNQKAITPLLTVKLQAMVIDCIDEVTKAL